MRALLLNLAATLLIVAVGSALVFAVFNMLVPMP